MNTHHFMLLISMSVLALTASTGKRQSCPCAHHDYNLLKTFVHSVIHKFKD